MDKLFSPFNPTNFGDLFTMMWVGSFVILAGAVIVIAAGTLIGKRRAMKAAVHEAAVEVDRPKS